MKSITYDLLSYKPTSCIYRTAELLIISACALDRPCNGWEHLARLWMFAGLHLKLHWVILYLYDLSKKIRTIFKLFYQKHPRESLLWVYSPDLY